MATTPHFLSRFEQHWSVTRQQLISPPGMSHLPHFQEAYRRNTLFVDQVIPRDAVVEWGRPVRYEMTTLAGTGCELEAIVRGRCGCRFVCRQQAAADVAPCRAGVPSPADRLPGFSPVRDDHSVRQAGHAPANPQHANSVRTHYVPRPAPHGKPLPRLGNALRVWQDEH
ncbi:hypothetical protein BMS3Bbin04_00881 [bacterium BMS3Bbin04]|nr:hypothetical protein BMS3Bbin04_00881 [bacterium BMS3Bbin04]